MMKDEDEIDLDKEMGVKYIFRGNTTFINKPRDTEIKKFQNKYITGKYIEKDNINSEILKLLHLVLDSKNLSNEDREETAHALNSIADQVKENKCNKLTLKGTLTAIQEVVSKAADIADPSIAIISEISKLLGIGL
ncbi:MAG TPA: hypothetical protein GXX65_08190 [Methanosarcina sp.]|nr:hypothetical protein [Methanosarcina sp.]